MKLKKILLLNYLVFIFPMLMAQENSSKYLGLEAGTDFLIAESPLTDRIRGDVPAYYNSGTATKNLSILFSKSYVGVKGEWLKFSDRLGIAAGVRFTGMHASIGKDNYWGTTSDFFYYRVRQQGNTTEYLKIKSIEQNASYLGIPVEIRVFSKNTDLGKFYVKAGLEADGKVHDKTVVNFSNESMNTYQAELNGVVGKFPSFYAFFYGAFGLKYGKPGKPTINLEMELPCVVISKVSSGLVRPQSGGGVQLMVQIPIKLKIKEQEK